jgi:tetratricopeptide (TPR) repeat protein
MIENQDPGIARLIANGNFAEATAEIKAAARQLIQNGAYATLQDWITGIPAVVRERDDELSLILAQSLVHTGEIYRAGGILNGIIDQGLKAGKPWPLVARALTWRSAAHRLAGNLENAVADAKAVLSKDTAGIDPLITANAEFRLGNALLDLGKLNDAIGHFDSAAKHSADSFDLDLYSRIQNSLGSAYLRRGDMKQAAVHFEYAVEGWEKAGNSGSLAMAMNSQAYLCQRSGQFGRAREILGLALSHARNARSRRIESSLLIAMGVVQRELGEFGNSVATLKSAFSVAGDTMEKNFASWAKAELGDTYRRMGQHSLAVQTLTEAVAMAVQQRQSIETDIFNMLLGISKFVQGMEDEGLDLLLSVSGHLEHGSDRDALGKCYFFLACCCFRKKETGLSRVPGRRRPGFSTGDPVRRLQAYRRRLFYPNPAKDQRKTR